MAVIFQRCCDLPQKLPKALNAALDIAYSRDDIGFKWNESEEGDQVEGVRR
jgi:hypothetical protein